MPIGLEKLGVLQKSADKLKEYKSDE